MLRRSKYKVALCASYIFYGLLAVVVLNVLIGSKVAANIYPNDSTDHMAISSKAGNWYPPTHTVANPPPPHQEFYDGRSEGKGNGSYNCEYPNLFPPNLPGNPSQDEGACATGLDATETRYKLFHINQNRPGMPNNAIPLTTTLRVEDACKDTDDATPYNKPNHPDKGGRKIRVGIFRTQQDGGYNPGNPFALSDNFTGGNPTNCGGPGNNDLLVQVPKAAFTTNQANRYTNEVSTALVVIYKQGGVEGNKLFKLNYSPNYGYVYGDDDCYPSCNGGRGNFAETSNRQSNGSSTDPSNQTSYSYIIKADCRINSASANILVGDVDWADPIQRPAVYVYLADISQPPNVPVNTHIRSIGARNYAIDPDGQFQQEHYYALTLQHVGVDNGLRIYLPFSEFNDYNCPQTTPRLSIGCQAMTVLGTQPGHSYFLHFKNLTNYPGDIDSGRFSGNQFRDTFRDFRFLYPHIVYQVTLYEGFNNQQDQKILPRCMTATCETSIQAATDIEPGEQTRMTYGIKINFSGLGRTFANSQHDGYRVRVDPSGGLSIPPGSNVDQDQTPPGPSNHDGWFPVTANYTGSLTAHLLFSDYSINIDDLITNPSQCTQSYTPNTRPTIKIQDGDISTGGGFKYKDVVGKIQCPAIDDKTHFTGPSSDKNDYAGGIRTFADATPGGSRGSSADFGAYALGLIEGVPSKRFGFYSGAASTNPGFAYNAFNFAHPDTLRGSLGGVLGGYANNTTTNPTAHCAEDFFDTTAKVDNPTFYTPPANVNPDTLLAAGDGNGVAGQYFFKGPVNISGSLSAGKSYTIYVKGNVNITNDITYGAWSFDGNGNPHAPYLTIIAQGDIHIAPNVTKIEGLYIAQPLNGAGGDFSTCSINGRPPTKAEISTTCHQSSLTINGVVIAQHIYPLRSIGTVIDGQVAERIKLNPALVIGQPNFKTSSASSVEGNPNWEDLYSLPPIF